MLLPVASSKRGGGGDRWRRRAARARRKQRYQRFPRALVAYTPHTTPGAAENPQKHTKQRPTSPFQPSAATPALYSSLAPVTCTRYTRAHQPSVYEQRRRNMDFSRSDVLCALCRREHVHGPRVRFDEPRASMREREREREVFIGRARTRCILHGNCLVKVLRGLKLVPSRASPSHLLCGRCTTVQTGHPTA